MAKNKFTTVSTDEFFKKPEGPPAPFQLGNQKPIITRKGNVKIPKPGPEVPTGTPSKPSSKTIREKLNNLRDLNPAGVENPSFEPVTFQLVQRDERLFLKNNLYDRLQEARAAGDKLEETRLMRLIRNTEELRKAKVRPYKTPGVIESLEEKIAKDIASDPQRSLARGVINDTFNLEVDPMYHIGAGGKSRIYADVANEYTAERIATGKTGLLKDVPTERITEGFRPISKAQKDAAKRTRELYEDAAKVQRQSTLKEMGIPINAKVLNGNPPIMQGYQEIDKQNLQLNRQAARQLRVDAAEAPMKRFNEIPLNYELRSSEPAVQAAIKSEATKIAATRTSETVTQEAAKITNRTAGIIAEDTMRAASVLHSSKLGGAAVGTMAIMGAFGVMSLKGSQSRRQREVTGG